ncbi:MAG: FG-GAP-like repeat-containing protein [Vicinamibacterales bacterium]
MLRRMVLIGMLVVSLGAAISGPASRRGSASPVSPTLVQENNRAVGLMGQFDFGAAVAAFEALEARAPSWPGARLNLAVALMNRQGSGDEARAEDLLRPLVDAAPVARRARYVLGLLLTHEGRDDEARPLITGVADSMPPDGFAAYFAGQLRLSTDPEAALAWYRRAAEQEPLLRSAFYGAFLALRRLQREDEAAAMLERFQALDGHPQALVAEFKYTRMGPLSEVITVDAPTPPAPAPQGPVVQDAAPLVAGAIPWRRGPGDRSITLADMDTDGALDVFVASALDGTGGNAVLRGGAGGFTWNASHPLAAVPDVRAALWGDLDDDGRADVVLARPGGPRIWRQDADGAWSDRTADAGVPLDDLDVIDGAVFDADHDGDLDIWLVTAGARTSCSTTTAAAASAASAPRPASRATGGRRVASRSPISMETATWTSSC